MYVLAREKQIQVVSLLCEGCSIRAVERLTQVHRDTVCRLALRVGRHCKNIMEERMQNLKCESLQIDELWGFVAKKQRNVRASDPQWMGDQFLYVALDAKTKLVPAIHLGKRDEWNTRRFLRNVARRIQGAVQVSTDGFGPYTRGVPIIFGPRADYCQVIKNFETNPEPERRYSPPAICSINRISIAGYPNPDQASTSFVEAQNLTVRAHVKRLARLTAAFSKRKDALEAACWLHYCYYNFCKIHKSLRMTPAMKAGLVASIWTVADLVPDTKMAKAA